MLSVLSGSSDDLDVEAESDSSLLGWFPDTDTVVRVTRNGCSCQLLQGLGQRSGAAMADAHVAGPGYAFRRGIAAATLAFGGVRLLIHKDGEHQLQLPRVTGLGEFLRLGLTSDGGILAIVP